MGSIYEEGFLLVEKASGPSTNSRFPVSLPGSAIIAENRSRYVRRCWVHKSAETLQYGKRNFVRKNNKSVFTEIP